MKLISYEPTNTKMAVSNLNFKNYEHTLYIFVVKLLVGKTGKYSVRWQNTYYISSKKFFSRRSINSIYKDIRINKSENGPTGRDTLDILPAFHSDILFPFHFYWFILYILLKAIQIT